MTKVLIAGAIGAVLMTLAGSYIISTTACASCGSPTTQYALAGAVVGAGVQLSVMALGVS